MMKLPSTSRIEAFSDGVIAIKVTLALLLLLQPAYFFMNSKSADAPLDNEG